MSTLTRRSTNQSLLAPALLALALPLLAEQTGPPRRLLVADDSVKRLAIVAPDGSLEWELKIGAIHDAQLLPNGNILTQLGWQRVVEVAPDKQIVWEYDSGKMNGNAGKPVEVHAIQRLDNGLLSNRTPKPLKMNVARFSCYSPAVKGSAACSGADHDRRKRPGPDHRGRSRRQDSA